MFQALATTRMKELNVSLLVKSQEGDKRKAAPSQPGGGGIMAQISAVC